MTWDEFFSMNVVGCDIQTTEGGYVYKGPIKEIVRNNGKIIIRPERVIRMVPSGKWLPFDGHDDIEIDTHMDSARMVHHNIIRIFVPGVYIIVILKDSGCILAA